jgi:membrane protein implicated in regulation of membrane protease activity
MPTATEFDRLPYESAENDRAIEIRIKQLEAHSERQLHPLKWAARFGKAGAIAIATLAFIRNTNFEPLQPVLIGLAAACFAIGAILYACQKPWKAAFIGAALAALAIALLPRPAAAAARQNESVGDAYIGCIAKTVAIALRSTESGVAAEGATKTCKSFWPQEKLTETERKDLKAEAEELIQRLIEPAKCGDNEHEE